MRILWITPELPYWPGGSGGSTRQFHLIRALHRSGHEVDVVAPVHQAQRDGVASLAATGAGLYLTDRGTSRVGETARALSRRPRLAVDAVQVPVMAWQVDVFWTRLREQAAAALARRPDVINLEHDWAARWGLDLPPDVPVVLTLENLSWRYYEARAAAASGAQRTLLAAEAKRFLDFDRRHLGRYAGRATMSPGDARILHDDLGLQSSIIPNGVDTAALDVGAPSAAPTALFTGTFGYPPNAEALEWLLRDIWPRVVAQLPAARLVVVGRDVPPAIAALADPGTVTLAGWVPAMPPYFAQARAVLVPMRSGAGTRLKVLDGLASGRALVTTTMGAEGVEVRVGEHALFADGAEAFAAATVRALTDDALTARLGAAGRALAQDVYDWRAIGARYAALLEGLAARGASASAAS
jgi:glycosyltransferase involved in cell wall biosynthesis